MITIALLRKAFRAVKTDHPFQIDAIVVLPDPLHCIGLSRLKMLIVQPDSA